MNQNKKEIYIKTLKMSASTSSALVHKCEKTERCISGRPADHMYQCDECNACFSRNTLLVAHRKKHEEGPPYYCGNCSLSFESEDHWLDHREIGCKRPHNGHNQQKRKRVGNHQKHKESRYKCHYCLKYFKAISARNDHERNLHKGLRPHSCSECGKTFYRKFNLTVHKRKHSIDRPHDCKICNKKFKANHYVKMHMQIHSDNRPFMCEVCGKVFKTISVLESHQTIHTGECSFTCNICSKPYRYRASLFIHMRTHTGQRPYVCDYCSASFMVKSHLTEHLRIHTGEKPFACSFCSACFSRTISLKKHLKSHIRAGLDVNIDTEMYHAKLQARVTPRGTDTPKETGDSTNNAILCSLPMSKPLNSNIVLYTNLPADQDDLVIITISSVEDGKLFVQRINQTGKHRISPEAEVAVENFNPPDEYPLQGEELIIVDNSEPMEVYHLEDMTQCTISMNEQTSTNSVSITSTSNNYDPIPGTPVTGPMIVESLSGCESSLSKLSTDADLCYLTNTSTDVELSHQNKKGTDNGLCYFDKTSTAAGLYYLDKTNTEGETYDCDETNSDTVCCPDKTVTNSDLYREWIIPSSTVTSTVQKSNVEIYSESLANEEPQGIQVDDIYRRQEEDKTVQSVVGVEYLERTTNTDLTKIPGKNYEEILVDSKLHSILLTHQDLSIRRIKNISSSEEEPDKFLLPVKEEIVNLNHYGDNSAMKCPQNSRKPLRKCRYCDTSYRYTALLEAHEANHELQINSTTSETECTHSEKKYVNQKVLSSSGSHFTNNVINLPFKCIICNYVFGFRSELRKHVKLHSGKYQYTCKHCHHVFQQEVFLAKHRCGQSNFELTTLKHRNPNKSDLSSAVVPHYNAVNHIVLQDTKNCGKDISFECDICGKRFHKAFVLKVHKRKHTGVRPYKCNICYKAFISATHRKVHCRLHTSEQPYVCQICNKSFSSSSEFQNHTRLCKTSGKFEVFDTDNVPKLMYDTDISETRAQSFHSADNGIYNMKKQISVKSEIPINIGAKIIKYAGFPKRKKNKLNAKNLLDNQIADELQTEKVLFGEYKVCDELSTDSNLQMTVAAKPQMCRKKVIKLLQCNHCPKQFTFQSLLHCHERCHTGEKPFYCSVCGKTFSKKSNLNVHRKIHTGERSFLCDYCGKYFMYRYSLEAHKHLHTKEKPFVCNICGKLFRYKTSRHIHLKRHDGNKAFKCDLCAKTFVTKVDMEIHRRTHTGEKPYKCEECGRKFSVRHHLTDHQRLHSGEKPYKCQFCYMSFARIGTQKLHMRKHIKSEKSF